MIQAEVATTLDRIKLTADVQKSAFLNESAYYSTAPWKYTAFMRLHSLESPTATKSNSETMYIASDAAMFARKILGGLQGENVPTPVVCPTSGGSVAIIWTVGLKQLEAIFGPDKSGSFVFSDADEIVTDGELTVTDHASLSKALDDILAA